MKFIRFGGLFGSVLLFQCLVSHATPSSQVFIPSVDVQASKTLHLGIDNYVRTQSSDNPNYFDVGLTGGLAIQEKVLAIEAGIDYLQGGQGGPTFSVESDKHPVLFNAKAGVPEGAAFAGAPGFAVGGMNFGLHQSTRQDIVYGLAAKTVPVLGRISAGYYRGSEAVLGVGANRGVLLSWDRSMTEISDKLWLGVDHMGGENFNGSTNFGAAWAFSDKTSVLLGYDTYNSSAGGVNTFTTQLDVNFL